MNTYDYDIPSTFPNGLNLDVLTAAIKASSLGPYSLGASTLGEVCSIYFTIALDAAQLATLQGCIDVVNNPTVQLDNAKIAKCGQIDQKTNEILARGYLWDGVVLSLSLGAQTRLNGIYATRLDPPGGYPVIWNSLDDLSFVTLADANDVVSMHDAAGDRLRSVVDSGTAIKDEVRACTTIAQVEAIVDPRK